FNLDLILFLDILVVNRIFGSLLGYANGVACAIPKITFYPFSNSTRNKSQNTLLVTFGRKDLIKRYFTSGRKITMNTLIHGKSQFVSANCAILILDLFVHIK